MCSENIVTTLRQLLHQALQVLRQSPLSAELPALSDMFDSAAIQIDEAVNDLQRYRDRVSVDPERLQAVEARQSVLFDTARKHRVPQADLPALHQQLADELAALSGGAGSITALEEALATIEQQYRVIASALSQQRRVAAEKLAKQVRTQLKELSMAHCRFDVALTPVAVGTLTAHGLEQIEFLISTQPDAPPRALAKIASGGELSRISLAIQVVTARTSRIHTLVFDEVDVGIGGPTAVVVGKLLRLLGEIGQVLCVMHQAPVAARAHQHLQVSKQLKGKQLETGLQLLDETARVDEIARMIGGEKITPQSRAHAEEMLGVGAEHY